MLSCVGKETPNKSWAFSDLDNRGLISTQDLTLLVKSYSSNTINIATSKNAA